MIHDVVHALAPLLWAGFGITFLMLRHRRRMAEIQYAMHTGQPLPAERHGHGRRHAYVAPATDPAQDAEIEALKDRIRVLERIATASAIENRTPDRLAAEIEALREPKA